MSYLSLGDREWLHYIRKIELEKVLKCLPWRTRDPVLEIGCGDGFQTEILRREFRYVVPTELSAAGNIMLLKDYVICDARNLPFRDKTFGLIYSSNVLEHIEGADKCMQEMERVLKNNGLMVHSVPTVFWKALQFFLHYVGMLKLILRKCSISHSTGVNHEPRGHFQGCREIKLMHYLKLILFPGIHGSYRHHTEEFLKYKKNCWRDFFIRNKLQVLKAVDLYTYSPYFLMRFKLLFLRELLNSFGFTSCYAFILKSRGEQ